MAGRFDDPVMAGRDMVIGQDLIDVNIRPILLPKWFSEMPHAPAAIYGLKI
jgi:hypothetical protein